MQTVRQWLEQLGLPQYAESFERNQIDFAIAGDLTDRDLRELGVELLGHRKKLLQALATVDANPSLGPDTELSARPIIESVTVGGERRQITVLFCDLVGSTALASQLDPEQLKELLARFTDAVGRAVSRYDGYVYQVLGDAVVAYFGYPVAYEAEADRAIRAGLAAIQAVSALREGDLPALRVRVGIATGLVVAAHINAPNKQAVGETPNLAARLQAEAAPDALVICDRTRQVAGGAFEYQDLGLRHLKGIPDPQQVWQVRGLSSAATRFEAATGSALPPMVGRDHELTLLLDRWTRARAQEGQIVVISGDPGIGKSRTLRALRERLGEQVAVALQYQCSPYYTNSALYPILDHIERALKFERDEPASSRLDKVEEQIRSNGRPLHDARLIAAALSLPVEERYGPISWTPQRQKDETFRALIELIEAIAAKQPTLLLFEDVHWADPTTLELLDRAIDRFGQVALLVVITTRPEFTPSWARFGHVTGIELGRLSQEQGAAIVNRVAGGKPLPPELVVQIVSKTDGVPLFLEELSKAVLESGIVKEAADRYEYASSMDLITLPATLRDSLMARLDRLIPVKEIAQIGACLGREFSYELVAAISPMNKEELSNALDQLTASEVIFSRGVPPNAVYTFKHALVQDAAYESLLKATRRELHSKIARVLEVGFDATGETRPEYVAHHYTAAGLYAEAIPYWHKAGQRAIERYSNTEAIAHLTKGLELLRSLQAGPERSRQELLLYTTLGPALLASKGYASPQVEAAYSIARDLCDEIGDSRQRFRVLRGMWVSSFIGFELRRAHELAEELLTISESLRDASLIVEAHRVLGTTCLFQGALLNARQQLENASQMYDPERDRTNAFLYGQDPRVSGLGYLAETLWLLGYPEQALAKSKQSLAIARDLSHPLSLAFALNHAARLHLHRREPAAAQELLDFANVFCEEHGLTFWLAVGTFERGWALCDQGQSEQGLSEMHRGLAAFKAHGTNHSPPHYLSRLAIGYCECGDVGRAVTTLQRAIAAVDETDERLYEVEIHRLTGEILIQHSVHAGDEAQRYFRRALKIGQHQGAKCFELRTTGSLARLLMQQGKRAQARALLGEVCGWFTEGFDTKDLNDAKALLDELS